MALAVGSPDSGHSGAAILAPASMLAPMIQYIQYWYALVILVVFFGIMGTNSILAARAAKEESAPATVTRGPGGKPLPVSSKKPKDDLPAQSGPRFGKAAVVVFRILTLVVLVSFVASAIALFLHAFMYDSQRWTHEGHWWWCGESAITYIMGGGFLHMYFVLTLFEWEDVPTVAHLAVWLLCLAAELSLAILAFRRAVSCQHVNPDLRPHDRVCLGYWDKLDVAQYLIRSVVFLGMCLIYCITWYSTSRHPADRSMAGSDDGSIADPQETTPLLRRSQKTYDSHSDNDEVPSDTDHEGGGEAGGDVDGTRDGASSGSPRGRAVAATAAASARTCSSHQPLQPAPPQQQQPVSFRPAPREEDAAFYRPHKLPKKSWWEYFNGYSVFFPYLWPRDSAWLRFIVVICFVLLLCQRAVNIMVPMQVGNVTQSLLDASGSDWYESVLAGRFPLRQLVLLGAYWSLQGSGGLIASVRSLLWIRVSQYSYRALTTSAFEHVHSLSLDFHLGKRTGEVLSALNKGAAINNFLEQVTFNVVPMLIDLVVAIYFFWLMFGPTFAVLIGVNTFWYLYLTVQMAQTRADQRREMTNADREEEAVKNDSITSYETVKYFNAEAFEFGRYRRAIDDFQTAEAVVSRGTNRMAIVQALVYNGGRLLATILGAWKVSNGTMTVGDFTTLLAYLGQLQSPLNFFGNFYRSVQAAMISGERLLELFKIQPTVVDGPHVQPLRECRGHIRWRSVSFGYDPRRPALQDIDFECPPGTTTAFVGESGGGKSTIFRLMFRYYNTSFGQIEIDGCDVKDLTIDSVRGHIGVVPQDTTLFNDTVMFNLKYANQRATDEDVYEACKAAQIHDRIMSWSDGYSTKVGERGQMLSGGEKQRVAIARTILKNPRIIMLDEATSALDTNTEQAIQDKLGKLGAGRTLLIIAHRLSTITEADQIVVLHQGHVVEKGTHDELLAKKGRYAQLWEKQSRAERAAEHARLAQQKARKLLRKANITTGKPGQNRDNRSDGYNSMDSSTVLPASSDKDAKKCGEDQTSSSASSEAEFDHHS